MIKELSLYFQGKRRPKNKGGRKIVVHRNNGIESSLIMTNLLISAA